MTSLLNEHVAYTDTNGLPLVNGKIYIGTADQDPVANPITIYSDRELTTTLSNPQTLDAYGRATNKIFVPGKYSIQIDNSNDVQIYQDLDAGGQGLASEVTFTPSGTGASDRTVQDKLRDVVNAADFGFSTSNSNTANGTALRAAIDSLISKGGKIHINPGTYNIDYVTMLNSTYDGIHIIGASAQLTILNFTTTTTAISMISTQNVTWENMRIDSPNSNIMFRLELGTQVAFKKLRHTNVGGAGDAKGYHLIQSQATLFEEVSYGGTTAADTGFLIEQDSDATTFLHCNMKGGTGCDNTIVLTGGTTNIAHVCTTIQDCVIGGGSNASLSIASDADTHMINITNNYFETGTNAIILGNSVGDYVARQIMIEGNYFFGFTGNCINLNRSDNVTVQYNRFTSTPTEDILVNSDVTKNSNAVIQFNQHTKTPNVGSAQSSIRYQTSTDITRDRITFIPDDNIGTTWNPGSVAAGGTTTTTLTVTGAQLGWVALASFSLDLAGLTLTAAVSAADTVEVTLTNNTAGAIDLASGTLRALVIPYN